MTNKVILTGLKPTGNPHLGNYCGAIKPMIEFVNNKSDDETIYCFIADVHALNGGLEPAKIREFSYSLIASYIACGMDLDNVVIFRQSSIRQHAEVASLLTNVTSKGLMNRAHSYKAAVDKNIAETNDSADNHLGLSIIKAQHDNLKLKLSQIKEGSEEHKETSNALKLIENTIKNNSSMDAGINMGLFTYPILMATDILLYQTNTVPVGRDQVQHIEMARDIASTFNHRYSDTFTLPAYDAKEDMPEISGLDGRKMSKSYNNHIPIFCNENELKNYIKKIITDSAKPEEPKDITNSTLVQLYELFANSEKSLDFKTRLANGGFSYGDAKAELFELINNDLAPKREIYNKLMADRKGLEAIFKDKEEQARRVAEKTARKVRKKMGLVDTI